MVISTKAVHGLCMDPFHEDRMASCSDDGIIKIWDIRNPAQPILSFYTGPKSAPQSSSTLVRISFNPQRSGLLASLTKEATCLKVWDIQEGTVRAPKPLSRMDSNHALDAGAQQGAGASSGLLSRSHDREGLQTVRESELDEAEIGVPILWKSRRSKCMSHAISPAHRLMFVSSDLTFSPPIAHSHSKSVVKVPSIVCMDSHVCVQLYLWLDLHQQRVAH